MLTHADVGAAHLVGYHLVVMCHKVEVFSSLKIDELWHRILLLESSIVVMVSFLILT